LLWQAETGMTTPFFKVIEEGLKIWGLGVITIKLCLSASVNSMYSYLFTPLLFNQISAFNSNPLIGTCSSLLNLLLAAPYPM